MAFRLLLALAAPAVAVALYQLGYAATAYLAYGEASIGLRMLTPSIGEGLVPLAGELFLPIVQSIHFHDQTAVANCTMGGLGTLAAAFFITGAVISRLRGRHPFGNARWAKPREHKAMKIVERDGVVLGKSERKVLRARDELHTLLVGPTRSGKGVGPISATCFDWHGSMIVFDPKEEAYQRTAGYRADVLGQKVYQFRPLAERTDRFNPLDLVRSLGAGGDGFTDLSAIANFLVPPSGNQPMWSNEAKALFLGVVGYVMESRNYAGRRNLAEVQRLFVNERGTVDLLRHVLDAEPELPEYVRGRLGAIVNMEAKATASGFVSQARASLVSFGNPRVAAATAASDFDVASLRTTKQTIYVTVSPEEIEQSAELLRLTMQMIANVISRTSPLNARGLHRVLFVIDEFAKFGHMPELTSQLPLMAGYGVNIMLAVQNLSQLDKIYTKDTRGDIVANCGRKIYLGFNDTATAREVSETMGDRTVFHTDTNVVRRNGRIESRQASSRAFGRPLMSVDELMRMPDDRYVLIQQHRHPVLGRKLNIYNDRAYAAWIETPLPEGMRTRTSAPYEYEGGIPALQDAQRERADRTGMPSDGLKDGIPADEPSTKPRTLPSPSGKVRRKRQGDVTGSARSSPPTPNVDAVSDADIPTPSTQASRSSSSRSKAEAKAAADKSAWSFMKSALPQSEWHGTELSNVPPQELTSSATDRSPNDPSTRDQRIAALVHTLQRNSIVPSAMAQLAEASRGVSAETATRLFLEAAPVLKRTCAATVERHAHHVRQRHQLTAEEMMAFMNAEQTITPNDATMNDAAPADLEQAA